MVVIIRLLITLITFGPMLALSALCIHVWQRTLKGPKYGSLAELRLDDFVRPEERCQIDELVAKQTDHYLEKLDVYGRGDSQGIQRRASDGRFDARGVGRQLNLQLARLDQRFTATAYEIRDLWAQPFARHAAAKEQVMKQDADHRLLMRTAICLGCLLVATIGIGVYWLDWNGGFSSFIAGQVLVHLPIPNIVYGSMFLASLVGALPICWALSDRWQSYSFSIGTPDSQAEAHIEDFKTAPEIDVGYSASADEEEEEEEEDNLSPHEVLRISTCHS